MFWAFRADVVGRHLPVAAVVVPVVNLIEEELGWFYLTPLK